MVGEKSAVRSAKVDTGVLYHVEPPQSSTSGADGSQYLQPPRSHGNTRTATSNAHVFTSTLSPEARESDRRRKYAPISRGYATAPTYHAMGTIHHHPPQRLT